MRLMNEKSYLKGDKGYMAIKNNVIKATNKYKNDKPYIIKRIYVRY